MTLRQRVLDTRHAVVKIGSAVFLREQTWADRPAFAGLVEGIDALLRRGWRVTVVSSGAVAMGRQRLGQTASPTREIPLLQAYAALGQSRLMEMYEAEFAHYGRMVAQVLFSRGDLSDRRRYLNARYTLANLAELGAVPIINENDTVATDELRFGDNDQLAAMTAGLVAADTLILLSDIDGFKEVRESGEFGAVIPSIDVDDPRVDQWAGPSVTGLGRGGMISKVQAARMASRAGAVTVIAPGKTRGVLQKIAAGDEIGTVLGSDESKAQTARKVWLVSGALPSGTLRCDGGAKKAVCSSGASLLPSGIQFVDGDFDEGAVVELVDADGQPFARGVTAYSSQDLRKIAGQHSREIESILGFKVIDAAIHRDHLTLL